MGIAINKDERHGVNWLNLINRIVELSVNEDDHLSNKKVLANNISIYQRHGEIVHTNCQLRLQRGVVRK